MLKEKECFIWMKVALDLLDSPLILFLQHLYIEDFSTLCLALCQFAIGDEKPPPLRKLLSPSFLQLWPQLASYHQGGELRASADSDGGEGSRQEIGKMLSPAAPVRVPSSLCWSLWAPSYSSIVLHLKASALAVLSLPGTLSPIYTHGSFSHLHQLFDGLKCSLNRKGSLNKIQSCPHSCSFSLFPCFLVLLNCVSCTSVCTWITCGSH